VVAVSFLEWKDERGWKAKKLKGKRNKQVEKKTK
jgi:hypothetical protein